MQHPDEAKIHEWLDGALSPPEASSVGAHVAGCAECQPVVAEARGLIAAASRILNSLDNVPHAAVPAATGRRTVDRRLLQAAAMLAIVAGGGALIARMRPSEMDVRMPPPIASTSHTIEESAAEPVDSVRVPVAMPQPLPAVKLSERPRDEPNRIASTDLHTPTASDAAPAPAIMGKTAGANFAVVAEGARAAAGNDAPLPSLTVLRTEQSEQESRTYYEVKPNRIAILVEPATERSSSIGGFAGQPARVMTRSGIAAGVVGGATSSAARLAPVAADTIKWVDASGKTLLLFGPFSIAELSDLKQRILTLRSGR